MHIPLLTVLLLFISSCANVVTESTALHEIDELPPGAFEVISSATDFQIHALHPSPHSAAADGYATSPKFHDFAIIASATVTAKRTRTAVMQSIFGGLETNNGQSAMCFNPRHAVHIEAGDREVDFVICYECLSMRIYVDGVKHSRLTSQAPLTTINKLWDAAGLTSHVDKPTPSK